MVDISNTLRIEPLLQFLQILLTSTYVHVHVRYVKGDKRGSNYGRFLIEC